VIELRGIHRRFQVGDQRVRALDDVTLTIADGEYVSIMGPSGSGKSTLLNVVGLLDRPTEGHYLLDGRETTGLDDDALADVRARRIGFIFQSFHLVPRLTAFENVELPMVLAGQARPERRARADEVLAALSLTERAHHRPDQLSGGQRQRVAIARAMVMRPTVLLADEPTGNLDSKNGDSVMQLLADLHKAGATIVMVTHDPQVAAHAHRIVRIVDGQIAHDQETRAA
jgi:putative ABC transport system ATP-binding protein